MKTYVSKRTKFTKNSILISTLYAETFKKNFSLQLLHTFVK